MQGALTPSQLSLLVTIRLADEDEGGLAYEDLDDDARGDLSVLAERSLVEVTRDGESAVLRITWRGVELMRDLGLARE
jgi:hypothetical protein